ncbi:hypothetical protein CTI12_AA012350 [Artemisia annua]|uniref:DUF4283 domain-containing protein n=1 Tax=Artemisia annua TaxID=35608 RepID=A0A2U1QM78_ARTAN|nr:hypothetical protein CTI12_AA012350 [Artemisia annua]
MDNMNNTYTPSSSKITMTPEAIKKLVNNIVSVVLEGTTIVYPRRETGIPGKNNQESFMEYRPTHFKTPERMTIPTINQGIRQGVIPNGNNQKRKLTEIGTINPICCNFTNTQDCYRKHLEDRINYHHVFIAQKLSKVGKRFTFVRFIKVQDVNTIIDELCNTWIGSHKLYANIARFNCTVTPKPMPQARANVVHEMGNGYGRSCSGYSYANVVRGKHENVNNIDLKKDSIVDLYEECLNNMDVSTMVFACAKEFRALTNMKIILVNEGFDNVSLRYLGGLWISVECQSVEACERFQNHDGVKSWFTSIIKALHKFVIKERVAWINVEGIPLQAWTQKTFSKIASRWGELIYTVDAKGTNMYSVRLCIKTYVDTLIAESFKVNVRGCVTRVRAKEITGWVLEFLDDTSKVEVEGQGENGVALDGESKGEVSSWDDDMEDGVEESILRFTPSGSQNQFVEEGIEKTENPGARDSINGEEVCLDEQIADRKNGSGSRTQSKVDGRGIVQEGIEKTVNSGSRDSINGEEVCLDEQVAGHSCGSGSRAQSKVDGMGIIQEGNAEYKSPNTTESAHENILLNGFSMLDKLNEVIEFGQAMGGHIPLNRGQGFFSIRKLAGHMPAGSRYKLYLQYPGSVIL